MTASAEPTQRRIQVWDVPTRLFHWTLLILVVIAWFTGEEEGAAALVHRIAGEAVAGLLVFRVLWGFIGGEHARFASFAAGPSAIIAHLRDLLSAQPKRSLGHNPLGGVAVFLLLATTATIVVTGVFSSGEEAGGPFAGMWGIDLGEVHETAFRVLQGLVVLHVLGVIVESWKARDALLPAMFTGSKTRRPDEPGVDASRAGVVAFVLAAGAGLLTAAALWAQPAGASHAGDGRHGGDDHQERDDHD